MFTLNDGINLYYEVFSPDLSQTNVRTMLVPEFLERLEVL